MPVICVAIRCNSVLISATNTARSRAVCSSFNCMSVEILAMAPLISPSRAAIEPRSVAISLEYLTSTSPTSVASSCRNTVSSFSTPIACKSRTTRCNSPVTSSSQSSFASPGSESMTSASVLAVRATSIAMELGMVQSITGVEPFFSRNASTPVRDDMSSCRFTSTSPANCASSILNTDSTSFMALLIVSPSMLSRLPSCNCSSDNSTLDSFSLKDVVSSEMRSLLLCI
mmetsp:Transcript_4284/g.12139  ORF Transcript_4284/g.12139 Transcript_4284/m.12139 type:complete len:229 (-) Transcript_4284:1038-1724(-)